MCSVWSREDRVGWMGKHILSLLKLLPRWGVACEVQDKKIHHKTCHGESCLLAIRQPSFMLQPRDSSKPIPVSCFLTGKTITLAITALWPLSHAELFLLGLAEQHGLILPSAPGSQRPSMGERPQCCMADMGNSTWFCPISKSGSRTSLPWETACWTYSSSWHLVNDVPHVKSGRCLRNLWNNNLYKFHPVEIVVPFVTFSLLFESGKLLALSPVQLLCLAQECCWNISLCPSL